MVSTLGRNQKTMRNEETPARRTRRSFLKKSAMAGMGAQSALIFSGLVMTSYASGGGVEGILCDKDLEIVGGDFIFDQSHGGELTTTYCWTEVECFLVGSGGVSLGMYRRNFRVCSALQVGLGYCAGYERASSLTNLEGC